MLQIRTWHVCLFFCHSVCTNTAGHADRFICMVNILLVRIISIPYIVWIFCKKCCLRRSACSVLVTRMCISRNENENETVSWLMCCCTDMQCFPAPAHYLVSSTNYTSKIPQMPKGTISVSNDGFMVSRSSVLVRVQEGHTGMWKLHIIIYF